MRPPSQALGGSGKTQSQGPGVGSPEILLATLTGVWWAQRRSPRKPQLLGSEVEAQPQAEQVALGPRPGSPHQWPSSPLAWGGVMTGLAAWEA